MQLHIIARAAHAPVGLVSLAQAAIELQHIGDVFGNLIAGAVAAEDEVSGGYEGAPREMQLEV